jgi:hypothetical protein
LRQKKKLEKLRFPESQCGIIRLKSRRKVPSFISERKASAPVLFCPTRTFPKFEVN